jgi:hypothetical protein
MMFLFPGWWKVVCPHEAAIGGPPVPYLFQGVAPPIALYKPGLNGCCMSSKRRDKFLTNTSEIP